MKLSVKARGDERALRDAQLKAVRRMSGGELNDFCTALSIPDATVKATVVALIKFMWRETRKQRRGTSNG